MTPLCRICEERFSMFPAPELRAVGLCQQCYEHPPRRSREQQRQARRMTTRRLTAAALLAVAAIAAAAAVTATTWTALVLGMIPAGVAFTLAAAILTTPHRKDTTPMKHIGRALLALAALAALAAIWAPVGAWWQWAITAVLALLIAASILGQKDDPR